MDLLPVQVREVDPQGVATPGVLDLDPITSKQHVECPLCACRVVYVDVCLKNCHQKFRTHTVFPLIVALGAWTNFLGAAIKYIQMANFSKYFGRNTMSKPKLM